MPWSDWRNAIWPAAPDEDRPERRPPHEPGTSHDGYAPDLPPPRDRPRAEPADRPGLSYPPVDVPEPDGDYDRPGAEVWSHASSPRGHEERNR